MNFNICSRLQCIHKRFPFLNHEVLQVTSNSVYNYNLYQKCILLCINTQAGNVLKMQLFPNIDEKLYCERTRPPVDQLTGYRKSRPEFQTIGSHIKPKIKTVRTRYSINIKNFSYQRSKREKRNKHNDNNYANKEKVVQILFL